MYIRVKDNPASSKKSVQIVHSVRQGDTVSQKILRHVGMAEDDAELTALRALAESIKARLEAEHQGFLFGPEALAAKSGAAKKEGKEADYTVNLKRLSELERIVAGIHDIYGAIFEILNLASVFKNPARQKAAVRTFRNIVLARIANPESKRGSVAMLEEDFGISINLDSVYKMMDKLDKTAIEKLNLLALRHTKALFPEKIDVIFFDCTTLYFESFTEDDFKRSGYSKDLVFNQPQVLLALMVTKEGLPVGYRAFPGDTYEGHTVAPILADLRRHYDVGRIIFVADAGLGSEDNRSDIEKAGMEYIVGCRLRNLSKALQEKILDLSSYTETQDGNKIGRFDLGGKTLLVSFSRARAEKDAHDREKAIERLATRLKKKKNPKEHLSNYGSKKYLKVDGKATVSLDEERIERDKRWDGLHGVLTNVEKLSDEDALAQYRHLWEVENAFRITKHDLKVRPVFHWKPERVRAHLAICFAAYMLVKHLEYRVRLQYVRLSPEKLRQTLVRIQTSILYDSEKKVKYALPSKMPEHGKKLYRLFSIERSQTPYILEKM